MLLFHSRLTTERDASGARYIPAHVPHEPTAPTPKRTLRPPAKNVGGVATRRLSVTLMTFWPALRSFASYASAATMYWASDWFAGPDHAKSKVPEPATV